MREETHPQGTGEERSLRGLSWRHRDHTRGSLYASILVLALPLFASSALGSAAFQFFDLTFLSRLGEAPLTAVVIVNQTLRQVVMLALLGISFASQALIARSVGEGRLERAEQVTGQALLLGVLFSTLVATLGFFFADELFSLPGPDASFAPYGVPYLRLVFLLNFGLMGSMLLGAILGGAGDTTTPLFLHITQSAVAILGEWVLMFGNLGMPALGVRGTALGIACGQLVSLSFGIVVLFRGSSRVRLQLRNLRPNVAVLGQIAGLSWPPAVQMVGGVLMTFTFLQLARGFGESVQTAYAIGLRLSFVVPMVCFPIATACATLVGQALGAGDVPRAWRAIAVTLSVHGSVMISFAIATFLFRNEIVAFFSDDPEVIAIGSEYLLYAAGSFAFLAFQFVFMRALQGAGDMIVPMSIGLAVTLTCTLPLAVILTRTTDLGPTGIWIAHFSNAAVSTLATAAWLFTGRWTRRRL